MKYFDYAATTPIDEDVFDTYKRVGEECFYNAGCNKEAKTLETETRERILKAIGFDDTYTLVFTSGGTESNNLAILGLASAKEKELGTKLHFITSSFEHASVHACFKELEAQGHEVTYVNIDSEGYVIADEVTKAIKENTVMVSIMGVNNELGTIQPTEEIFKAVKAQNSSIVTMVDWVQGLGKATMNFDDADFITISSHKIYGPKGVGALIKKKDIKVLPLIFGGTNEFNMRAGLQSLPAQVAFAEAVEKIVAKYDEEHEMIEEVKNKFISLCQNEEKLNVNCAPDANVVSVFVDSEAENTDILAQMEDRGFYLSARSADSAGLKILSRSLLGIGLDEYKINRTMRISFSHLTTTADVEDLFTNLVEVAQNN